MNYRKNVSLCFFTAPKSVFTCNIAAIAGVFTCNFFTAVTHVFTCNFVTAFAIFFTISLSANAQVVYGPMLGQVELRTAQVWVQVEPTVKSVAVKYFKTGQATTFKTTAYKGVLGKDFNTVKLVLTGLDVNTAYDYQFIIDGKALPSASGHLATQELWQWRKAAPDFTFLTGSCAYFNEPQYDRPGKPYGGDSSIFETMAKDKATFMLWLGDNWYTREADYQSEWGLNYRPMHDRSLKVLQPFWKAMSHYAIWDDHDYGPNDADKSYVLKDASRRVFVNNWCNPSFGENGQGVYTKFSYSDVDFFLLDDRWFRSNDNTPDSLNGQPNDGKRMFGKEQMEWLKNALRLSNSNANTHFRIIATGSQVLNPMSPWDCLRHYPSEYKEMMDFLSDEKINGVVFITGDRHLSEINKAERMGSYPLYDITSSPLTSGRAKYNDQEKNNSAKILSVVGQQNYSRITFSGQGAERKMKVEFVGLKGDKLAEWEVKQVEVSAGK